MIIILPYNTILYHNVNTFLYNFAQALNRFNSSKEVRIASFHGRKEQLIELTLFVVLNYIVRFLYKLSFFNFDPHLCNYKLPYEKVKAYPPLSR